MKFTIAIIPGDGIGPEVTSQAKKALDAVATIAIEQKLGARGLRKILDRALIDIQYELPDLSERGVTKIVITDQTIKDDMPPLLVKG